LGFKISNDFKVLEIQVGRTDSVLQIPYNDLKVDLQNECQQVAQLLGQERHENRQGFPTAEAAMELVFIALQNTSTKWTMPIWD
jgi:hypothetical protein